MKWVVVVLIFAGLLWLWRDGGGFGEDEDQTEKVALSERMVLDERWRSLPEREMAIGEMERYAAGLSEEELWGELEKSYLDWFEMNRGRKWFDQPRLAVMLARELGKRDGERGMKAVAEWLGERHESEEGSETQWGFFEERVRVAGFAGWVSVDAEEAIVRLIEVSESFYESSRGEFSWPVTRIPLFAQWLPPSEFFAMDEILREGFRSFLELNEDKARDSFLKGAKVGAFDANEVVEAFLDEHSKINHDKIQACLGGNDPFGVIPFRSRGEESSPLESNDSFASVLDSDVWSENIRERLIEANSTSERRALFPRDLAFLFARAREAEAIKVVKSKKVDGETKGLFVAFLGIADAKNYYLLSEVSDVEKMRAVRGWLEGEQFVNFGPITGNENPGALDLERLKEVLIETEMGDEVRKKIVKLLDN